MIEGADRTKLLSQLLGGHGAACQRVGDPQNCARIYHLPRDKEVVSPAAARRAACRCRQDVAELQQTARAAAGKQGMPGSA